MEQIKVNMTPCGFTPTIHASQNDDATRKWAFDLYDENGKIDSSDIKEQMIFDSRVGGTEQILPENTSDPTTSPIIADIQYPDSLRSEQTFLYRKSPTTEDGQAKITKIKGNTVVFNQLLPLPTLTSRTINGITWTNNGDGSVTANGTASANSGFNGGSWSGGSDFINDLRTRGGHYVFCFAGTGHYVDEQYYLNLQGFRESGIGIACPDGGIIIQLASNISTFETVNVYPIIRRGYTVNNLVFKPYIVDLTQMFGSGNEPTSVDQFTSLYPLPYYDYTQGKLLPFKGESLKTTGKNLLPVTLSYLKTINVTGVWNENTYALNGLTYNIILNSDGDVEKIKVSGTASAQTQFLFCDNYSFSKTGLYVISGIDGGSYSTYWMNTYDFASLSNVGDVLSGRTTVSIVAGHPLRSRVWIANGKTVDFDAQPMFRFIDTDSTFEPYTSSTINLPTLNYFPSGIKSAGNVYDEVTESKAITKIGEVIDLGELSWIRGDTATSGEYRFYSTGINSIVKKPANNDTLANIVCSNYMSITANQTYAKNNGVAIHPNGSIFIYDESKKTMTADQFKTSVSGMKLYFELATPSVQSITTASLVTEKGESPLYYDDELIADCNETISSESGIFDAKIKLMDDETIYSQKIQLHVERKPQ